jgi:hypothetical protein
MRAMKLKLKALHALLGIKQRAMTRMERILSTQRAELMQCQQALQQQSQRLLLCQEECARHDRQLEARLAPGQSISAQGYLAYATYRPLLLEQISGAAHEEERARQQLNAKQEEIRASQQAFGKTTMQRNLISEKIRTLQQMADESQQQSQDDESTETSLAHHHQSSAAARQENPH